MRAAVIYAGVSKGGFLPWTPLCAPILVSKASARARNPSGVKLGREPRAAPSQSALASPPAIKQGTGAPDLREKTEGRRDEKPQVKPGWCGSVVER